MGVLAAVLMSMAAIRMDQALLRRNANRLLNDIQRLQVGTSTQRETQQLMHQWPQAAKLDGDCSRRCGFIIVLDNFFRRHNEFFINHRRLMRLYTLLGGQLAEVRAGISFVNGVRQSETVGVYLYVSPYRNSTGSWSDYTLIGGASFVPESQRQGWPHPPTPDKLHPTYFVGPHGGCDGCLLIDVRFLSGVSTSDVNRLMQFDFSCLTRWWYPCRTQGDLMPAAWEQYLADEARR